MPNTDCTVAVLLAGHSHHERALAAFNERRQWGEELVLASSALVELYAVLTRLPTAQRIPPEAATAAVEATFLAAAHDVVALSAEACRQAGGGARRGRGRWAHQ